MAIASNPGTSPAPPPAPVPPTPTDDDYKNATEHLWKSYAVINEWIRFADAKAGALLTVNGVLIGVALGALKDNQQFLREHWLIALLCLACGASLVASAAYSLLCIKPILKVKLDTSGPSHKSTIYFEHIAGRSNVEFRNAVLDVKGNEGAFKEIAAQVHPVSVVARTKHMHIASAVNALIVGFALGVLLLLVLAVMPLVEGGRT